MTDAPPARPRRRLGFAGGVGLSLLLAPVLAPSPPRLVWNSSASAPVGLYWVSPNAPLSVGSRVAVRLPPDLALFAAGRRYLPLNVVLVKRVAAIAPSRVCTFGPRLVVDGRVVANRLPLDGSGRILPWWLGCRALGSSELLLLGEASRSFDGRYFGPIDRTAMIGTARLIWPR